MNKNRLIRKSSATWASRAAVFLLVVILTGCSTVLVDSYKYGRIDVTTLMESGEPAAGLALTLYRNTEILAYGSTDQAGKYSFEFVPFGVVGVYVQLAPGYETEDSRPFDYQHNLDLSEGQRISLLFSGIRAM